ncbi:MAG: prefoldin subunit beta [Candidatus Altiarchaeota archaeon]|nr:prefoldin subunit beta [Candidatus Altiarchaeota archaeon]
MNKEMSPQQKYALTQVNIYQQQMQVLISQRQQVELQLKEIEVAHEELEKEKIDEVYKAIGPALIKKKKVDVLKDLIDAKEKLNTRIMTIKSQEKKLGDKMKELSSKLER